METKVKAVKMIIGGRIQNNVDSMSNRIKKLILLVRKTWGSEIILYVDANGSHGHQKEIEVGKF